MPIEVFRYRASLDNIDTGQPLEEVANLARCDGATEPSNLAEFIGAAELPNVALVRISPTLRFDRARAQLRLELEVETRRALESSDRALLLRVLERVLESWSYSFELPDDAWQVHFETTPLEASPPPQEDELASIRHTWPMFSFASLSAMSDAALDELLGRLRPLKSFVTITRTADAQHARALLEAAESQRQRRAQASIRPQGDDWI